MTTTEHGSQNSVGHIGRTPHLSDDFGNLQGCARPAEIWRLLESDTLRADDVKIINGRLLVAPAEYSNHLIRDDGSTVALVDKSRLLNLHDHNASIIITDAWRYLPGLRTALSELSIRIGQHCRADIGISKGGAPAPPIHARQSDQAFLAVSGEQDWLIWTPPAHDSADVQFFTREELATASTETKLTLAPPDVLFVPRRWPYTHTHGSLPTIVLVVSIGATTAPTQDDIVNDSRRWHLRTADTLASVAFASSVTRTSDLVISNECVIDTSACTVAVRGRTYRLPITLVARLKELSSDVFKVDAVVPGDDNQAGLRAVERLTSIGVVHHVLPNHGPSIEPHID